MPTVRVHMLGCKVNQYDAAAAQYALRQAGYTLVDGPADIAVVYTCSVTAEARRKSLQALRRAAKTAGLVAAAGCVAQTEGDALLGQPKVRLVVGCAQRAELPALLQQAVQQPICAVLPRESIRCFEETPVDSSFAGRARAHVKVQEGFDNHCHYCLVPQARGQSRSRPVDAVRAECLRLVQSGVQEIVLVGINLAAYGSECGLSLADAVEAAAESGVKRLRLGSMEANLITPDLVARLADVPSLCPHFYLPLQSGSPSVQARMGRVSGPVQMQSAVRLLRAAFPGCLFNTDCMVAYPGETEQEFMQTVEFCQQTGFARMHVFAYSPRPGTPAANMPDPIPPAVAAQRVHRLMQVEQQLRAQAEAAWLGREVEVLWETADTGHTRHGIQVFGQGIPNTLQTLTASAPHPQGLWVK